MKKRIIFLDIDGTLTLPGCNEPPESALEAIRQAQARGHFVFLCTGRNYNMLSPLLKYGFDGVVGSAGGYIECRGKAIYDCPMTESQKQLVMETLEKNGIYRTIECMEGSFTDEGFKEFLRTHAQEGQNSELLRWRQQIEASLNIRPMGEYGGQPAYKVVFMSPTLEQLEEPRRILEEEFLVCVQDEGTYGFVNGEIINRKFDKGQAVRRVCEYLNVPVEDTVAFGDSMNDREMLETAGLSICMRDGNEKLKSLVDDVCPAVQEDGIQYAFRKYGLMQ